VLKRIFDFAFSTIGLIFLSPLLIVIAFLMKIDSKGAVFYRGLRVGRYGKSFKIFKFRTMVVNAEEKGGPSTALNDARLTAFGKFLRKYKLDEFPQLINILKGEMSFVGPRPQVEKYTLLYSDEEKIIFSVRPGLTDYASIRFIHLDKILGNEKVDEKYLKTIEPEKNRLRIQYVKDQSICVDFTIIVRTILQLFKIRSLWNTKD